MAKTKKTSKGPYLLEEIFIPKTLPPPDIHYWSLALHRLTFFVAVVTLVFVILGTLYGRWLYMLENEHNREIANKNAEITHRNQDELAFKIIIPSDGDSVKCNDTIQGFSPYPNKRHYLLITTKWGDEWVQRNNQMRISPGGKWICPARFGENLAGRGEIFVVRCIATDTVLEIGKLGFLPKEAIISNAIKVYRKFDGCPPLPPLPTK